MSGPPSTGRQPRSEQRPMPPAPGFYAPRPSYHIPMASQGIHAVQSNAAYQSSVSPETLDTDMVDDAIGSSHSVSNAASPPDARNGDEKKIKLEEEVRKHFASKVTKDGKVPKKRGPKPDNKPAKDRRQQMNRQAQRKHRARKDAQVTMLELAIKEAKDETARILRRMEREEAHGNYLEHENRRLKQLLDVNQIPYELAIPQEDTMSSTPPRHAVAMQQNGLPIRTANSFVAPPPVYPTAPTTGPTTVCRTGPLSVNSSSADADPKPIDLRSSLSPISSMDGAYESNAQGNGVERYDSGIRPLDHQHIVKDGHTPDALAPQQSGPINGQESTAGFVPHGSILPNHTSASSLPDLGSSVDPQLGHSHPPNQMTNWVDPSVNGHDSSFDNIESTRFAIARVADPTPIANHDQSGVQFILDLESNCHDHKTLMNARTFNGDEEPGGHSLMLSKVPLDYLKSWKMGDQPYPHEAPDVGMGPGKWARLLSLVKMEPYPIQIGASGKVEGEVSPAQALGVIRKDPRYAMLNTGDLKVLTDKLRDVARCYGFGAVVEVYEIEIALDDIFAAKGFDVKDGCALDDPIWATIPISNPHTLNGPQFPTLTDSDRALVLQNRRIMDNQVIHHHEYLARDLNILTDVFKPGQASNPHQFSVGQSVAMNSHTSTSSGYNPTSAYHADHAIGHGHSPHSQASYVNLTTSNAAVYPQIPAFDVEHAAGGPPRNYQYFSPEFNHQTFNNQHTTGN